MNYLEAELAGLEDVDLDALKETVEDAVGRVRREARNRARIKKIDDRKSAQPASSSLDQDAISSLPSWVREQLESAEVIGTSGKVILLEDGRKYHLDNRLNHLSGAEWTYFLTSVFGTRFPTTGPESFAHAIRKGHPSPKPPQLMRDIIKFFTKENELVLDYFAGVGGTLLGAAMCGRRALGIELDARYVDLYRQAAQSLALPEFPVLIGDSIGLLRDRESMNVALGNEAVDLIVIDPPYGEMMAKPKTGQAAKQGRDTSATPFTESRVDLGNVSREEFWSLFAESVNLAYPLLKSRGHLIVFIKDLQPTKEDANLLHADLVQLLNRETPFRYLGLRIWADEGVNLYPYGYPYAFVANQIHQYVLVFKKDE